MTDAAGKPEHSRRKLLRWPAFVRALIALIFLGPVIFGLVLMMPDMLENTYVGNYRSSPFIFFVILFPPAWLFFLIVHFSNQEELAWNQHVTSLIVGVLFVWFLLLNWAAGIFGFLATRQMIVTNPAIMPVYVGGLVAALWGCVILGWVAIYYGLRSLPPPLGHRPHLY